MFEPERKREPLDDSNSSGVRRSGNGDTGQDTLPPTPPVIVQRPRIVTGRYTIVSPPRKK